MTRRAIIVGARAASLFGLGLGLRVGKTEAMEFVDCLAKSEVPPEPPVMLGDSIRGGATSSSYLKPKGKGKRDRNKRHRRV